MKYRFFAYFDFLFDEPLKHDTYSPYISLLISDYLFSFSTLFTDFIYLLPTYKLHDLVYEPKFFIEEFVIDWLKSIGSRGWKG